MKWYVILILILLEVKLSQQNAAWECKNVDTDANCKNYKEDDCNKISVFLGCQKQCGFCDDPGWSKWTHWGDCSASACNEAGQRVRSRQCMGIRGCYGSTIDQRQCTRTNCTLTEDLCNSTSFICPGVERLKSNCILRLRICDGYKDCLDNSDEIDCEMAGGPTDVFGMSSALSFSNCARAVLPGSANLAWHCATTYSPYYQMFRWKWHRQSNLRNIGTGLCLARSHQTYMFVKPCDAEDDNQLWECDEIGLALIDKSLKDRYLTYDEGENILNLVDANYPKLAWKIYGQNDSLCSTQHRWTDWSQWSPCSNKCVALGVGDRTRVRKCTGGISGRGFCNSTNSETEFCDSPICRPQCPPGFDNSSYAWACYRLFTDEPKTLLEAEEACRSLEAQGVPIGATLAADKDRSSHKVLKNILIEYNGTEDEQFYIGSQASIADGKLITFNYSNDGSDVGDVNRSRDWHDVIIDLSGGWPGGNHARFYLKSQKGFCLGVNSTSLKVFTSTCTNEESLWRYQLNYLMHNFTGLCLSYRFKKEHENLNLTNINGTNFNATNMNVNFNATNMNVTNGNHSIGNETIDYGDENFHDWYVFVQPCDMKKGYELEWDVKGSLLHPKNSKHYLSVVDVNVTCTNPEKETWIAKTAYSGDNSLGSVRDLYGAWFKIREPDLDECLTVVKETEFDETTVTMLPCSEASGAAQLWGNLFESLVVNRQFVLCLGTNATRSSKSPPNDTSVTVVECDLIERMQQWNLDIDNSEHVGLGEISQKAFRAVKLTSKCKSHRAYTRKRVCLSNHKGSKFQLIESTNNPNLTEVFKLTNVFYSEENMCLRPNGSEVIYDECKNTFWQWKADGLSLISVPDEEMCLSANEYFNDVVMMECSEEQARSQMWKIVETDFGSQIVLAQDDYLVLSLAYALDPELPPDQINSTVFRPNGTANGTDDLIEVNITTYIYANRTEGLQVYLKDMKMSKWRADSSGGGSGTIKALEDCWQSGQTEYHGQKSWTRSGVPCQPWVKQFPHRHEYEVEDNGPYCRNPPSHRLPGSLPWCLTNNDQVKVEECVLPQCPDHLGLTLTRTGVWRVTGGNRKLNYICEAPVECSRGPGYDYSGTVNNSYTGTPCLNWRVRHKNLNQPLNDGFSANHSFCRNPDRDPKGPWCWISRREREYCSHILQCPVRCENPPQLFRSHILAIWNTAPGVGYANLSTVLYECDTGFYRLKKTDYDLKCINGKWYGDRPSCRMISCEVPEEGVVNASPQLYASSLTIGSSITYKCFKNFLMAPTFDTVTFTCSSHNTWSADWLPVRFMNIDHSHITNLSEISCVSSCPVGMFSAGHWCIKAVRPTLHHVALYDTLTCDEGTKDIPPEVVNLPDIRTMLHSISHGQFLVGGAYTDPIPEGEEFNETQTVNIKYRSYLTEKVLKPDVEYRAGGFYISTGETDHGRYCLTVTTSVEVKFDPCPAAGNDTAFQFYWLTAWHLFHPATQFCLSVTQGANPLGVTGTNWFHLVTCEQSNVDQHIGCDSDVLFSAKAERSIEFLVLDFVDPSSPTASFRSLDPKKDSCATCKVIMYAEGNYVFEEDAIPICNVMFRPRHQIFQYPCFKASPDRWADRARCNHPDRRDVCTSQGAHLVGHVYHLEKPMKTSWTVHTCDCGYTKADGGYTYSVSRHFDCPETGYYRPYFFMNKCSYYVRWRNIWCREDKPPGTEYDMSKPKSVKRCLFMNTHYKDGNSQVYEAPCNAPVTERICAVRAKLTCPPPQYNIPNGNRTTAPQAERNETEFNVGEDVNTEPVGYILGSAVTYTCNDGFMFANGRIKKKIKCLADGSWSINRGLLVCVPRSCSRPKDPAYAFPLSLAEDLLQVPVGTSVEVLCKTGYVISDGVLSQTSTCQPDARWDPAIGTCQTMNCDAPPAIEGFEIFGNSYRIRSVVTYKCKHGSHLVTEDGSLRWESKHTCDKSGNWLPNPASLSCVKTDCPTVPNLENAVGEGVGKAITISCKHGDSFYNSSNIMTDKEIKAVCLPTGRWTPNLDNITCGLTPCRKHVGDITNSRFLSWTNYADSYEDNKETPVDGAVAEYQCNKGYHTVNAFRIFIATHEYGGCLTSDELTPVATRASPTECTIGFVNRLLWQWLPRDTRLLQHVDSGLCLTSSVPGADVRSKGHAKVVLEQCVTTNERQLWNCYTVNGIDRYVGLADPVSAFPGNFVVLRYSSLAGIILSNSFDGTASEFSIIDNVTDICTERRPVIQVNVTCTRQGMWVPNVFEMGCVATTCPFPKNRKDIVMEEPLLPSGDTVELDRIFAPLPYRTTIEARCAEGMSLKKGNETLPDDNSNTTFKCDEGGEWVPSFELFKCFPIFCEALSVPDAALLLDTSWSYMSVVRVACRLGLWFKDIRKTEQQLTCGRHEWSVQPSKLKCEEIICSTEPELPGKEFIASGGNGSSYAAARVLHCPKGHWFGDGKFVLVTRCSLSGEWMPKISCSEIMCSYPPPHINYARALTKGIRQWRVGDQFDYRCARGRHFHNTPNTTTTVTCDTDGQWNPNPNNMVCHMFSCLSVDKVRELNPRAGIIGASSNVGSRINLHCQKGFSMRGGRATASARCRITRKWFPPLHAITCKPVFCGRPLLADKNGDVVEHKGFVYGTSATIECVRGYSMDGMNAVLSFDVQCSIEGIWMPDPLTIKCVPVTCYDPVDLYMATFKRESSRLALFEDKGVLCCLSGYWFSPAVSVITLTCGSEGLWEPNPMELNCVPVKCRDPGFIPNSRRKLVTAWGDAQAASGAFQNQDQVVFKCMSGFWFSPGIWQQIAKCQTDGTWNPTLAEMSHCVPVACTDLPTIEHASIVGWRDVVYGLHTAHVAVIYRCDVGWWFDRGVTEKNVTCSIEGRWEPPLMTVKCLKVKCPYLPTNVKKDTTRSNFGAQVHVSCAEGYSLSVSEANATMQIQCDINGNWIPDFGTDLCVRVDCGKVPYVANAVAKSEDGTRMNDVAIYVCDTDMSLMRGMGAWAVKCSPKGVWLPTDNQCVKDSNFVCDMPPVVEHAKRDLPARYLAGQTATYKCDEFYWMSGNKTSQIVTCEGSSLWTPDPASIVCHPLTCVDPPTPVNATRYLEKGENASMDAQKRPYYKFGTVLRFRCDNGFWMPKLITSLRSVCGMFGVWKPHPSKLECKPTNCPLLPSIEHADYELYVNGKGRLEAKFSCKLGFLFSPSLLTRTRFFTTSCWEGKWIPSPIQRSCEVLFCSLPPEITDGFHGAGGNSYGKPLQYYCISGYRFIGTPDGKTNCNEDGDWDPHPSTFSCIKVDCGEPMDLPSASVTYTKTELGDTAVYTCDTGKWIEATGKYSATVTCKAGSRWSPTPVNIAKCVNITCLHPLPHMNNTRHSYGLRSYGDGWTFDCSRGFHIRGDHLSVTVECGRDGRWAPSNGTCVPHLCGRPPKMANARVTDYTVEEQEGGTFAETARYECVKGTWISSGLIKTYSKTLNCVNGQWEPAPKYAIFCVTVTCDVLRSPPDDDNLEVNVTRSHHEFNPVYRSTVHYGCPPGKFLAEYRRHKLTARCQHNGRWNVEVKSLDCVPTFCPHRYNDSNAVWSHDGGFTIGSSSQVTCLPTYWLGEGFFSLSLTCSEDGRWAPEKKCVPIHCPPPNIQNSEHNVTKPPEDSGEVDYPATSTISFECNPGYFMSSPSNFLVCQSTGTWNPDHTSVACLPVTCTFPQNTPPNSQIVGAVTYNSTLKLYCDVGFVVATGKIAVEATCQEDATWTRDLQKYECTPIICFHTGSIRNGNFISKSNGPNYPHMETVRVSCLKGFWFERGIYQFSSQCNNFAEWEPPLEEEGCSPVTCRKPERKMFATMISKNRLVGTKLILKCDPVYWIATSVETEDEFIDMWSLRPMLRITSTCLTGGIWDYNFNTTKCISTADGHIYTSLKPPPKLLPKEESLLVASSPFMWLSRNSKVVINGPGDGTEVGQWIDRVAIQADGDLHVTLESSELGEAMADPRYRAHFRSFMGRIVKKEINCSAFEDDDASLASACREVSGDDVTVRGDVLLKSAELLKNTTESGRVETLKSVSSDNAKSVKRGRHLGRFPKYASKRYISHNETALIDGDPFTAWTPMEHAITWQFELHLGKVHYVDKVMLMMDDKVEFDVTFLSQSEGARKFKDIDPLLKSNPEMTVSVKSTQYGEVITLSDFGVLPATMIRFRFKYPPTVRELSMHAAPAKWFTVVSVEPLTKMLIAISILFGIYWLVLSVVDYMSIKRSTVQWFGNVRDGLPCIVRIATKKSTKKSRNAFLLVHPEGDIEGCHIAWFKTPTARYKTEQLIGVFVEKPKSKVIEVSIGFDDARDETQDDYVVTKKKRSKWILNRVDLLFAGGKWKSDQEEDELVVIPKQRTCLTFYPTDSTPNKVVRGLSMFFQTYLPTFLFPASNLMPIQLVSMVQRLVIVLTSLCTSILLAVAFHRFTDMSGVLGGRTEVLSENSSFLLSRHSLACLSVAVIISSVASLVLQIAFMVMAKNDRKLANMGKERTTVIKLPGVPLFNLVMAGSAMIQNSLSRFSLTGDKDGDDDFSEEEDKRVALPTRSMLIAWIRERRNADRKMDHSTSAPAMLRPSAGDKTKKTSLDQNGETGAELATEHPQPAAGNRFSRKSRQLGMLKSIHSAFSSSVVTEQSASDFENQPSWEASYSGTTTDLSSDIQAGPPKGILKHQKSDDITATSSDLPLFLKNRAPASSSIDGSSFLSPYEASSDSTLLLSGTDASVYSHEDGSGASVVTVVENQAIVERSGGEVLAGYRGGGDANMLGTKLDADLSMTTLASGRRTIYPHPDNLLPQSSLQPSFALTPSAALAAWLVLMSGVMMYATHYLVAANRTGSEAVFLVDVALQTAIVMSTLGYLLEALCVIAMKRLGLITPEINLQHEASDLVKTYKAKRALLEAGEGGMLDVDGPEAEEDKSRARREMLLRLALKEAGPKKPRPSVSIAVQTAADSSLDEDRRRISDAKSLLLDPHHLKSSSTSCPSSPKSGFLRQLHQLRRESALMESSQSDVSSSALDFMKKHLAKAGKIQAGDAAVTPGLQKVEKTPENAQLFDGDKPAPLQKVQGAQESSQADPGVSATATKTENAKSDALVHAWLTGNQLAYPATAGTQEDALPFGRDVTVDPGVQGDNQVAFPSSPVRGDEHIFTKDGGGLSASPHQHPGTGYPDSGMRTLEDRQSLGQDATAAAAAGGRLSPATIGAGSDQTSYFTNAQPCDVAGYLLQLGTAAATAVTQRFGSPQNVPVEEVAPSAVASDVYYHARDFLGERSGMRTADEEFASGGYETVASSDWRGLRTADGDSSAIDSNKRSAKGQYDETESDLSSSLEIRMFNQSRTKDSSTVTSRLPKHQKARSGDLTTSSSFSHGLDYTTSTFSSSRSSEADSVSLDSYKLLPAYYKNVEQTTPTAKRKLFGFLKAVPKKFGKKKEEIQKDESQPLSAVKPEIPVEIGKEKYYDGMECVEQQTGKCRHAKAGDKNLMADDLCGREFPPVGSVLSAQPGDIGNIDDVSLDSYDSSEQDSVRENTGRKFSEDIAPTNAKVADARYGISTTSESSDFDNRDIKVQSPPPIKRKLFGFQIRGFLRKAAPPPPPSITSDFLSTETDASVERKPTVQFRDRDTPETSEVTSDGMDEKWNKRSENSSEANTGSTSSSFLRGYDHTPSMSSTSRSSDADSVSLDSKTLLPTFYTNVKQRTKKAKKPSDKNASKRRAAPRSRSETPIPVTASYRDSTTTRLESSLELAPKSNTKEVESQSPFKEEVPESIFGSIASHFTNYMDFASASVESQSPFKEEVPESIFGSIASHFTNYMDFASASEGVQSVKGEPANSIFESVASYPPGNRDYASASEGFQSVMGEPANSIFESVASYPPGNRDYASASEGFQSVKGEPANSIFESVASYPPGNRDFASASEGFQSVKGEPANSIFESVASYPPGNQDYASASEGFQSVKGEPANSIFESVASYPPGNRDYASASEYLSEDYVSLPPNDALKRKQERKAQTIADEGRASKASRSRREPKVGTTMDPAVAERSPLKAKVPTPKPRTSLMKKKLRPPLSSDEEGFAMEGYSSASSVVSCRVRSYPSSPADSDAQSNSSEGTVVDDDELVGNRQRPSSVVTTRLLNEPVQDGRRAGFDDIRLEEDYESEVYPEDGVGFESEPLSHSSDPYPFQRERFESNEAVEEYSDQEAMQGSQLDTSTSTMSTEPTSSDTSLSDIRALRDMLSEIKAQLSTAVRFPNEQFVDYQRASVLANVMRTQNFSETLLPSLLYSRPDSISRRVLSSLRDELEGVHTVAAQTLGIPDPGPLPLSGVWDEEDVGVLYHGFKLVRRLTEMAVASYGPLPEEYSMMLQSRERSDLYEN